MRFLYGFLVCAAVALGTACKDDGPGGAVIPNPNNTGNVTCRLHSTSSRIGDVEYHYGMGGRLDSISNQNEHFHQVFEYNAQGQVIRTINDNYATVFVYDAQGYVVSDTSYYYSNGILPSGYAQYTYANGKLAEERHFNYSLGQPATLFSRTVYTWQNGLLVQKSYYVTQDSSERLSSRDVITYTHQALTPATALPAAVRALPVYNAYQGRLYGMATSVIYHYHNGVLADSSVGSTRLTEVENVNAQNLPTRYVFTLVSEHTETDTILVTYTCP